MNKFLFFIFIFLSIYFPSSSYSVNTTFELNNSSKALASKRKLEKSIAVKFSSYDYKLTSTQFKKFLTNNNLIHNHKNSKQKNIIYFSLITKKQHKQIIKNISKNFNNISTGMTSCLINGSTCLVSEFGMKDNDNNITTSRVLKISPFYSHKKVSAEISGLYKTIKPNISIDFYDLIENVINNDYIFVSQKSKNGFLYGQIILLSIGSIE